MLLSGLILGIEFAAVATLFDGNLLKDLVGETKKGDGLQDAIGWISLFSVVSLAAATFYYDYQINIESFRTKTITIDHQILGIVMVFMSELFFWISNICEKATGKSGGGSPFK